MGPEHRQVRDEEEIRMLVPQRAKAASSTKRNFSSSTTSSGSSTGWTEKQSRGWTWSAFALIKAWSNTGPPSKPYTRFPLCGRDKATSGASSISVKRMILRQGDAGLEPFVRPASWSRAMAIKGVPCVLQKTGRNGHRDRRVRRTSVL